ncbi:anti-sigma factor [Rhizobium sp. LjRoot30]|uniref:anti-sigma factor family protein n=1 Tax=Rhizobium sp. LjRoot30 TaxID=3342320 RepID=UPI003ECD2D7C
MNDLRKLPLDVRLSALLDGEVQHDEKDELERLVATNGEAREIYDRLKRGSEIGNVAFEEFLKEPVPLAIVRKIKKTEPPQQNASRTHGLRPRFVSMLMQPQVVAASLALFVIGGGLGYFLGSGAFVPDVPVQLAQAPLQRSWLDDIAAYHRVYARQQRHLAEVPPSEADHIVSWLTDSVGVGFKLPDLASDGLEFKGARLLVAQGKPVAQLLYRNQENDIIAICFMKNGDSPEDGFDETIKDDIGLVSWHKGPVAYVVVGPSSEATLTKIAEKVSTEI